MQRFDVYSILAKELEFWRLRPYEELRALVDHPPSSKVVRVGEEEITLTVLFRWADLQEGTIRIEAIADGPTWWRLERVRESIIIARLQPPEA